MGDSRPGGPVLPPGQYTARQGATSAFAGPFLEPWHDIQMPNARRDQSAPYKSRASSFPCCILRTATPPASRKRRPTRLGRRKSHRKIKVMKQWRMTNKKYWLYYFREQSGLFLFLTHTFATLEFFRETTFCLGFFFLTLKTSNFTKEYFWSIGPRRLF